MNYKFLWIVLFLSIFSFGQKTTFNIKYSEHLAVFVFIQNLSDDYPENVFKTAFQKSRFNNEENQSLLKKFDGLNFDYSFQFEEFPYGSKFPMQTIDLVKKNLIETSMLNDFVKRSIGIAPNKTLISLADIITVFTPIYNELIYNPNKLQFEKQLVEIIDYSERNNIQNYFQKGLKFYNSSWENAVPFEIAFYPIPNSQSFTAQAFYNNSICGIMTNLKSYKDLFSVMLHEIFHIIYDQQSLEVKNDIDKWFKENKSKNSNYAFLIMNEVLATALGNGYVYEELAGKIDSNEWYYSKYIDLMSRKIYPLVKEYVKGNRCIDKSFIDNYIKIYDDNFSTWINELDNIMAYRFLLSENKDDLETISKMFWYVSLEESENEITDNSLTKMQSKPLTKFIIVSKNNDQKLKLIKSKFVELKNWKYSANDDFAYRKLLGDKTQLIILNKKKRTLEDLISLIK